MFMSFKNLFFFSKNLQKIDNNKLGSTNFITIIGNSFGIFFCILTFTISNGIKNSIEETISNIFGCFSIDCNNKITNQTLEIYNKLNAISNITTIGVLYKPIIIHSQENSFFINLIGYENSKIYNPISQYIVSAKQQPEETNTYKNQNTIVISKHIAKILKAQIGDTFVIEYFSCGTGKRKVEVAEIYDTGFPDFDKNFAISSCDFIRSIDKTLENKLHKIQIHLKNKKELQKIENQLNNLSFKSFIQKTSADFSDFIEWISLIQMNSKILILFMIIIVCSISASSSLIFFIKKQKSISLLKALGMNSYKISAIFAIIFSKQFFKSILIGDILAFFVILITDHFIIQLDTENNINSHIPLELNFYYFLYVNTICFTTTALTSFMTSFFLNKHE